MCRSIRCPVVVIHGTDDASSQSLEVSGAAELTGARVRPARGLGPCANSPRSRCASTCCCASSPSRWPAGHRRARTWTRGHSRPRRALFVSSPIGLGHAWRDVAIADELRRQVPGLEIHWLAQEPVTTVLRERGETIHPASAELASEAAHIDREARRARPSRLPGSAADGRDPLRELHGVRRPRARRAVRRLDRRRGVGGRPLPAREPRAARRHRTRG